MMMLTQEAIEILLDVPEARQYVVSAYADMTVQDGFSSHVERHLRNQARAAEQALAASGTCKDLDANLEVIRAAIAGAPAGAKGLAVFSSVAGGLRHVVPLGFPVANHLVIDEEPYILPLLEHWFGEPSYLIALVDSDEAHLFEVHHGHSQPLLDLEREDLHQSIQRDKPRFTYKKRFAKTDHERLHGASDDKFLHEAAAAVAEHAKGGPFAGLVLLGQPATTQALRRLLPRDLDGIVVGEAPHAMTDRPEDIAECAGPIIQKDRAGRDERVLTELRGRRKRNHLVADGPTEVLDALQQGRATRILLGRHLNLAGARCRDCNYRLGAPVGVCPYCQGLCRAVNSAQEIMRMATRHRIPVHLLRPGNPKEDPLAASGGVSAFVRAEANWAPNGSGTSS